MANFNSNNPMLRKSVFTKATSELDGELMTRGGAIGKTVVLFILLLAGAAFAWSSGYSLLASPAGWITLVIAGTALSFATAFIPRISPVTSPIYALVEGLLIGALSAAFAAVYNGIVLEAVLISIGIFVVTLVFYSAGIIRVTNRFRMGVLIATLGIGFTYLASFAFSLFGLRTPLFNDNGLLGIAINLFIVIIAGLNFMLDFDYIDRASQMGAPKYMEWYMGFSLMVTFVWLYMEVIRLLSRIQGSSR